MFGASVNCTANRVVLSIILICEHGDVKFCLSVCETDRERERDRPGEFSYLIGNSHSTTILTAPSSLEVPSELESWKQISLLCQPVRLFSLGHFEVR